MKVQCKVVGLCLLFCLLLSTAVAAYDVIDADYSAAILTVMSEGRQPQERLLVEIEDQNVQEVAVEKQSYTTDILTVREMPGTQYNEISKLAKYTKVDVIGVCDNGWSHVYMENGLTGYVSNQYLSDIVPEGAKDIGESLGLFTVTYYCSCPICCGWWSGGPTASGAYPVADWTIAADPDILPLGTRVYINGHEYCVEDTGSGVKGYHVDIYVDVHNLAVNNGVGETELFVSLG